MTEGSVWSIVVGAGSGQRFGGLKQYEMLGDRRVIDHAVAVAREASDGVVIVVAADDAEREGGVAGGETRTQSVLAGLNAVPDEAAIICVHDAARPFADVEIFERVIAAVRAGADGAIPGVSVTDTIKVIDTTPDGTRRVGSTPERSTLVAVQTPQAFRADRLREAHRVAADARSSATDDAALVEGMGGTVVVIEGSDRNRKITSPEDLVWARAEVGR
ncbi:MAG: 2-C-methyl-D-erythritol 4-phosphate cytidylyltransferase [Actinomycetota bacterium]|nr:2-C-methyl-D-erythritol 4-phosphate cytidylyltransferase [Actinomycetota bacterium]MDA3014229.1 2-C-methyl-D-erythritol 4-phosphate cytidylyltransferase [Actinomycetota bacterium]